MINPERPAARVWWGGVAVGAGPQVLLIAYLLLTVLTAGPEDRGYAAYLLLPQLLIVPVVGVAALACLAGARSRRFGLGALTGLAVGVALFLLILLIGVNV